MVTNLVSQTLILMIRVGVLAVPVKIFVKRYLGKDVPMSAECSQCGACCHPVSMMKSKEELLNAPGISEESQYNQSFIMQNFTEVTASEADKMYPLSDHSTLVAKGYHFYRCS